MSLHHISSSYHRCGRWGKPQAWCPRAKMYVWSSKIVSGKFSEPPIDWGTLGDRRLRGTYMFGHTCPRKNLKQTMSRHKSSGKTDMWWLMNVQRIGLARVKTCLFSRCSKFSVSRLLAAFTLFLPSFDWPVRSLSHTSCDWAKKWLKHVEDVVFKSRSGYTCGCIPISMWVVTLWLYDPYISHVCIPYRQLTGFWHGSWPFTKWDAKPTIDISTVKPACSS